MDLLESHRWSLEMTPKHPKLSSFGRAMKGLDMYRVTVATSINRNSCWLVSGWDPIARSSFRRISQKVMLEMVIDNPWELALACDSYGSGCDPHFVQHLWRIPAGTVRRPWRHRPRTPITALCWWWAPASLLVQRAPRVACFGEQFRVFSVNEPLLIWACLTIFDHY